MKRSESGSVAPLLIGFVLVIGMLVAVVVDVSAAYLRRESLDALADAAALSATEALAGEQIYEEGLQESAPLDRATAARLVAAYLDRTGSEGRFPGLTWTVRTSARTVLVVVEAPLSLPLRVPGAAGRTRVRGTAAAQVLVGR